MSETGPIPPPSEETNPTLPAPEVHQEYVTKPEAGSTAAAEIDYHQQIGGMLPSEPLTPEQEAERIQRLNAQLADIKREQRADLEKAKAEYDKVQKNSRWIRFLAEKIPKPLRELFE